MTGASLASKAPSAPIGPVHSPKFSALMSEAQRLMAEGLFPVALINLKMAVGMEPGNAIARAQLGIALLESGEYANAEEQLRFARSQGAGDEVTLGPLFQAMLSQGEDQILLDLYPDPGSEVRTARAATILRARAAALQMTGDGKAAAGAIGRSLAIRKDFSGLLTAGHIALLQGRFDDASAFANDALALSPDNTDAVVFKIDIALHAGRPAEALQMAERLVADKPNSLAARLARIQAYLSLQMLDRAKPEVDAILHQSPRMAIANYYRAIILAREGNLSGAWSVAHALPAPFVRSQPEIGINVADMAAGAGFLESAAKILAEAVFRNPGLLDARLKLAAIRLRQNSPQYALNVLALVEDSKDPRVSILFAQTYLKARRPVEARTYIDRAITLGGGEGLLPLGKELALTSLRDRLKSEPGNKLVQRQYALVLLRLGDFAGARVQYEQLVRAQPPDPLALNNLAWLLQKDDPRRALSLAQAAVKSSPGSADFLDTLGWMQLAQSDRRGALLTLQRAFQLRPGDPQLAYHLAVAIDANGSRGPAKMLLQAAVARGKFADFDAAWKLLASWH